MRLGSILTLAVFLVVLGVPALLPAEEFRVKGGTAADDFTDSQGRVWYGAHQEDQAWGGWIEKLPLTAEVANLTADAQAQAEAAGYDRGLFYAVSFGRVSLTVVNPCQVGLNGGRPIFINTGRQQPNPLSLGDIDTALVHQSVLMKSTSRLSSIDVSDGALDFHFAGNADTGAGDLNLCLVPWRLCLL